MYIYRIQDKNGHGCYQQGASFINKLQDHNSNLDYPTPQDDKGIDRFLEKNEICGFKDLTQLKKWFTLKEIKFMRSNGYKINKIEVEKITAYGRKQVLAIKTKKYIWRVENENGVGCYSAHFLELEDMYEIHAHSWTRHPLTIDDIGIQRNIKEEEICGFKDKKQALKWFTKNELKFLKSLGFELKKREVKEITAYGQKQLLAIPEQNGLTYQYK